MATLTPYSVTEFTNTSGTLSYRVSGSGKAGRLRKNFSTFQEAETFCNARNAEEAGAGSGRRVTLTFLTDSQLRDAEAIVTRAAGRWTLGAIGDAGIAWLVDRPLPESVAKLANEWFPLVAEEVNAEWAADLKQRVKYFLADAPNLTTNEFTKAFFREWLDGLDVGQQSKANIRNCVHRFAGWLIERGKLSENPAAGLRLKASSKAAGESVLPVVMSAAQAGAFMRACEGAECRRLKGWAVLCLFCGLRPGGKTDSGEAPLLQWAEIKFKTDELSVEKRKRGGGIRILKMEPQAIAWLKAAQKDGEPVPGQFWRHLRRKAVEIANIELHAKGLEPIKWDQDILRHTYASIRASEGVEIHKLATDMGTSASMIYAHYRHPRPAAEVSAFRKILPSVQP